MLRVCLEKLFLASLFYYSAYFCYYLWAHCTFDTIHRSHCIILANFYLHLQYFQQKVFSFNKISRSQINPSYSLFFKLKLFPNSIQKHIWNLTRSHEVWKFYWVLFLWVENSNFWGFCSYCPFSLALFLLFFNLEALLEKNLGEILIKRTMGLPIISTFYGFFAFVLLFLLLFSCWFFSNSEALILVSYTWNKPRNTKIKKYFVRWFGF